MEGILLPWNPRTPQRRRNNLLFYTETFSFGIHPGHLSLDLLKSLGSRMVMENHRSTKGVILRISEPYNDGTTEIPDKSISDRKPRFASHKFKRPFGFKSTTKTAHYPWKNRTTEWMNSETWKIFSPTLEHLSRIRTNTEARKTFQKVKETFYPQKSNKLTQKRERFSEESKKPSIFRNYHPELLNNWKSYPTFHASIPSTYRKHNVLNNSQHMKDDINETRKSTLTIWRITVRIHQPRCHYPKKPNDPDSIPPFRTNNQTLFHPISPDHMILPKIIEPADIHAFNTTLFTWPTDQKIWQVNNNHVVDHCFIKEELLNEFP